MFAFTKYFGSHKNSNALYYVRCIMRELYPKILCRWELRKKLTWADHYDIQYLSSRVNYYNKLDSNTLLSDKAINTGLLPFPKRQRVYYFDTVEFLRFFKIDLRANFLFGDITHVPEEPSITKSRPASGNNKNSVILKLEKMRHFMFVKYDRPFSAKKDMLVWRGVTKIEHRIRFVEKHFNNPLCNVGKINKDGGHEEWIKPFMTIDQHLEYKFILCIEGNDVATNLKWVMSSNSIAVMPKPKYETWFMEGALLPDYHYILIKDDYSDLDDRLNFFISNPDKAKQIIENAHEYVNQFRNKKREDLLSLLVLEKYFVQTGQIQQISPVKFQ